jgi:O-antigen ligase
VLPAHNVVFHAAAELGYPGAAVVGVLAVLVVVRIRRRGALALVPVCVLAPFFALEWYPYWFPTGIVLTSIAAGVALSVEERA